MTQDSVVRDDASGSVEASASTLFALYAVLVRRQPRTISLTSSSTLASLDRYGPQRITDLAARAGVAQPSMTSLAANLVREGYVERRSDPADGRASLLSLTDTGRDYLRTRRAEGVETVLTAIEGLTEDEQAQLAAALPALDHLREVLEGSIGETR